MTNYRSFIIVTTDVWLEMSAVIDNWHSSQSHSYSMQERSKCISISVQRSLAFIEYGNRRPTRMLLLIPWYWTLYFSCNIFFNYQLITNISLCSRSIYLPTIKVSLAPRRQVMINESLGNVLTDDGKCNTETLRRSGIMKEAWNDM